jgi:SAM-dependent methyltransferase
LSGPQADGRHFDSVAEEYDSSLPAHVVEHYLRKRTEFVARHHPPPARLLDVGCGTGALAARLAGSGYDVTGVDPSDRMLEVMRRRAPGIEAVHAGGEALPFGDGAFDLALTVATLHHVAAPDAVRAVLAEMARVVRPGGHVLIWDHNPRNPYWPHLMRRVPQDSGETGQADPRRGERPRARLHAAMGASPYRRARASGGAHAADPPSLRAQRRPRAARLSCQPPGAAPPGRFWATANESGMRPS